MISRTVLIIGFGAAGVLTGPARAADCIIVSDKKSISIVTDNSSDEQKNCTVNCRVDTVRGPVAISCGGQGPPHSKAHEMCNFDKPDAFYKQVLSVEGSCN